MFNKIGKKTKIGLTALVTGAFLATAAYSKEVKE